MRIFTTLLVCLLLCSCNEPEHVPHGSILTKSLKSVILNREIGYNMYLPASFNEEQPLLDIIYLLHGHGGDHHDWFEEEEGNVRRKDTACSVRSPGRFGGGQVGGSDGGDASTGG